MQRITASFLTADIVNSTALSDREMVDLREKLERNLKGNGCLYDFFRYDSIQILHRDPSRTLRLVFGLRALARQSVNKETDIRISLTLGSVPQEIQVFRFSNEELFVMSGRHFDQMVTEKRRFAIQLLPDYKKWQPGFTVLAGFSDYLLSRITPKQAEALMMLLEGLSQKEITLRLDKSPSTVHKLTRAMLWDEMEQLFPLYDQLLESCNS